MPEIKRYTVLKNGEPHDAILYTDHTKAMAEKDADISRMKRTIEKIHNTCVNCQTLAPDCALVFEDLRKWAAEGLSEVNP